MDSLATAPLHEELCYFPICIMKHIQGASTFDSAQETSTFEYDKPAKEDKVAEVETCMGEENPEAHSLLKVWSFWKGNAYKESNENASTKEQSSLQGEDEQRQHDVEDRKVFEIEETPSGIASPTEGIIRIDEAATIAPPIEIKNSMQGILRSFSKQKAVAFEVPGDEIESNKQNEDPQQNQPTSFLVHAPLGQKRIMK